MALSRRVSVPEGRTVRLDRDWDVIGRENAEDPGVASSQGPLAYVIYIP